MTARNLYFVRANAIDLDRYCVWAGHFYAATPTEAITIAKARREQDVEVGKEHGIAPYAHPVTWKATRSKSYANAMNAA